MKKAKAESADNPADAAKADKKAAADAKKAEKKVLADKKAADKKPPLMLKKQPPRQMQKQRQKPINLNR